MSIVNQWFTTAIDFIVTYTNLIRIYFMIES